MSINGFVAACDMSQWSCLEFDQRRTFLNYNGCTCMQINWFYYVVMKPVILVLSAVNGVCYLVYIFVWTGKSFWNENSKTWSCSIIRSCKFTSFNDYRNEEKCCSKRFLHDFNFSDIFQYYFQRGVRRAPDILKDS